MEFGPDYFADVPRYGLGIGMNPSDFHEAYLDPARAGVDFFEVTAPSARRRGPVPYADVRRRHERQGQGGFSRRGVRELAGHATVLVHSTNVNPVYAEPPTEHDLAELGELLRVSGSPWVTEDLGVWLMSERHVYPHFMPLPLTADTLAVTIDNVTRVQRILGRPFNAEFPPMSYVLGDMNAFEFFDRLCTATGCGMCVDVGHVLSYQLARGASATADFHRIPWQHVTEIHFAGGSIDLVREGFFYQDDHGDREVVSVCFDLIDEVIATAPHLRAIALELFGARRPERALRRLQATRERPSVRAWLDGNATETAAEPLAQSRQTAKVRAVALFDLLHSDRPISGDRLHEQGPELLDAFATAERRRWDYDRQSRLLVVGDGIASYFPVTASWVRRLAGWSAEQLYGRLIDGLDGSRPMDLTNVTDAFHSLLPDMAEARNVHELLRCETWMNTCVADGGAEREQQFGVDVDRAAKGAADPAVTLSGLAERITLVYLGDGRFARRGKTAPTSRPSAPGRDEEPPVCGTARCCSGD
ncbi:DUF692 domain-containing protein [Amycolatopsis sp. FBCC-B4732]|uniref:multinuclear nonheme iron-dependent oxidase n=1 Tax=Amycolatopsis sp. FBCC-B4732 TaxID=3079339 RepID=UPI001FF3F4E6|nr:DUF692 family multinuclear iron-containing protein [Amycolatopsis sp. FBCC-B4732]UOX90691.1 DUF692 domain-containing protein [Amycolatopsis sp. FBCC-B4732]